MSTVARSLWEGWKRVARRIGEFQALVIFTILYYAVIGPVGLVLRAVSDPLNMRPSRRETSWISRPTSRATLQAAMRQ